MISLQRQPAVRTHVPPLAQFLVDYHSTPTALLTGVSGIDLYKPSTGTFSLLLQPAQEAAPRDILNRTSKLVVPNHPTDVQILHSDKPVATNQRQRHLMMMLVPQIRDTSVCPSQLLDFLLPIFSAFLLTADRTLLPAQLRKLSLKETRILDVLAVRRGQKVLQANVNANRRVLTRLDLNIAKVARKDCVQAVALALNPNGFDLALDFSVHLDFNEADSLDAQLAVNQLDSVAIRRKLHGLKISSALKTRITRLLAAFDTIKERLEGLVQTPKRGLAAAKVKFSELMTPGAQLFKFGGLVAVVDTLLVALPGRLAPAKSVIVKAPVKIKRKLEALALVVIRVEEKLKGALHDSAILLIFDVLSYGSLANAADCAGVITARPQSREPGAQAGKLFAQNMRGVSLEPVGDFSHAKNRIGFNKQMHVVGADAHFVDFDFKLSRFLSQELFEALFDSPSQDWPTILRAPHYVVLKRVDGPTIPSVSGFHAIDYITADDISQQKPGKKRSEASAVA